MEAKSKNSFTYVHEEIVNNILCKLPDDSVLRFRCVSKLWCCIISGMKIKAKKVLVSNIPFSKIDQTAQLQIIDNQRFIRMGDTESSIPGVGGISLLGSWDELCLVMVDDDLYLWNPSNRQRNYHERVLSIRECINEIYPGMDFFESFDVIASGPCFDSVNGELKTVLALASTTDPTTKVVIIVGIESKVIETIDFPYEVLIFGSPSWKKYSLRSGPVVNNRLHWYIYSPSTSQQHVLYFDPNYESEFVELPLPEVNFRIMGLGVLDGCLCVARCHGKHTGHDCVDVIGMKEYGVKESWEIMFRMRRSYDYYEDLVPLFYTKNKDEVLLKGMGAIFTYNTKDQTHTKIYTCGLANSRVIVYEEYLQLE